MEKLMIDSTKSTPAVIFDPDQAVLSIKGQSYPENAFKFYEPIMKWLDDYLLTLRGEVAVVMELHLPYINTSSTKCFMMLLEKLEQAYQEGKKVRVEWYYHDDNESELECAEEFKEDLTLPFDLLAKDGD